MEVIEKKWSRILTALTVLGLSFGLAACANKKGNSSNQYDGAIYAYRSAHSTEVVKTPVKITFSDKKLNFSGTSHDAKFSFKSTYTVKSYAQVKKMITPEVVSLNGIADIDSKNVTSEQLKTAQATLPKAKEFYVVNTDYNQGIFESDKVNWVKPRSIEFTANNGQFLLYKKGNTLYNAATAMVDHVSPKWQVLCC
ncbi:hypothetical protein LR814_13540 (plasmid) [Furfurilactobacillus rossiae]|uniref:hypothetical protein n=1 Tax=Furfurilactobacillus rossiae TaxID=231049 RepID=UPI001265EECE|nr:hypothetical protein [Furfurilactobacillus rossiae]QFR68186.1 hypothetical protein LR814_13540 [Furfurilactobacillus rossiae]